MITSSRKLFIKNGFAGTGTPEIVAAAGVTRGALYHHFEDKADLFQAVVEAESAAVAAEIEAATPPGLTPVDALHAGSRAYLDAMAVPGRTRLLLVEAPAALDAATLARIDREHGGRTLAEGLAAALGRSDLPALLPLADILSAAFDRAALAISAGADGSSYEAALAALIDGLLSRA